MAGHMEEMITIKNEQFRIPVTDTTAPSWRQQYRMS
jgi:hypothetical protein